MDVLYSHSKHTQSGFTLIELVVVIMVLGIISAVAIPRFINLNDEARISTVQGIANAVQGGVVLARSKALARGVTGEKGNRIIRMEGRRVKLNRYLYPVTTGRHGYEGISSAVRVSKPKPRCNRVICKWTIGGRRGCNVVYNSHNGMVSISEFGCHTRIPFFKPAREGKPYVYRQDREPRNRDNDS